MMKKALIFILAVLLLFFGAMPPEAAGESIRTLIIVVIGTTIEWAAMGTVIYFTCKFWSKYENKNSKKEQDRQDS